MGYGCGAFHLGRTDDEISYQPYNGGEIPEESYSELDALYEERDRQTESFILR